MSAWLLLLLIPALTPQTPDVAVVCCGEYRDVLEPWVQLREQQGHHLMWISNHLPAVRIKEKLREARKTGLRFVVLIGDADLPDGTGRGPDSCGVPTHYAKTVVGLAWGSEPTLATDNWYADLDEDGVPELAVGRISVDTPGQLEEIVKKIIRYESAPEVASSSRDIHLVASVGGLGVLADMLVESVARKFISQGIPAAYRTTMTYGNPLSSFCPPPSKFRETVKRRFNEGGLFWVYIGHGSPHGLDYVRSTDGLYPIFDLRDVTGDMHRPEMAPIALFLACYTGAFDHPRDSLAEQLVRSPDGPVAAIAGSRVTMPYAMGVMSHELLQIYFQERTETLGELFLQAKQNMVNPTGKDALRLGLNLVARVVSPQPKMLREELLEHVQLFNLLGDPLLRIPHGEPATLFAQSEPVAGDWLNIQGECRLTGNCLVELVLPRERIPHRQSRQGDSLLSKDEMALLTYEDANDGVLASQELHVSGGTFQTGLLIPQATRGECYLRVFIRSKEKFALGSMLLNVSHKTAQEPESEKASEDASEIGTRGRPTKP